jgi:hypothetical protein
MTRVTSRAAKALASALVAAAAVAISPTSNAWAADELTSDPRALLVETAQQPTDLQRILQTLPTVEQEAVKADFWGRTASAIRATRSFSTLRYGTPAYAKWYAFEHITRVYNWDDKQFGCLVSLWTKESNWRYSAVSKNKKWYGIPQATKQVVTSLGLTVQDYMRAPELQVQAGARYINYRYGSPCAAWKHSSRKGWY